MSRSLKQTISVVVPLGHETGQSLTDPFFIEMLGHLAEQIARRGCAMLLQKMIPPMEGWLPRLIESGDAAGIVIVGQSTEHAVIEAAAQHYRPMVVWGGHEKQQSYCTVGTDNIEGARVAVEHLISTGRRRIVYFGDPSVPEIRLRYEGYKAALAGGPPGMATERVVPAHMLADAAYEAMQAVLLNDANFDAVFAATDILAISAIRAIIAGGRTVPGDIAVVGFDDIVLSSQFNPSITTMRQDFPRAAHMLIDLLFRRLNGEDTSSVRIPAELIVRESSSPAGRR